MKMSRNKSIGLVILVSAGITAFIYSDIIFHLNDFLFSVTGDGLKNYFNYLYHIKHDSDFLSFQGMNYPYGETIFMVDAHPLFSNILKFISQNIVDITPYSVGILNSFMLGSLIISSIFLFLILDYYKFPWYIAVTGAISIAFLSSNVLLWKYGHYALSYSCFFPIAWFLILKYQSADKKMKYSILILLNTLFWFYTHNYLGLTILGFTFAYHLFSLISDKKKISYKKRLLPFLLQVVIPAVFVYTVISIFDTHNGRIDMPYTVSHKASIYSVFFPNHSYIRPIYDIIFNLTPQENQSWCNVGNYIGFSTNLIIVGVVLYMIYKLIVHKNRIYNKLFSKNDIVMLLSGIALLIFSMAIPFRYGLEFLLPEPLKQFVALGRFAWAFYFVIIVISFILVREIFKIKTADIIILISIFILFSEGLSYHSKIRKEISNNSNIFNENLEINFDKSEFQDINFSDYQAIVPIPFYHKYISLHSYKSTQESEELSMNLSYLSGLPLMSAILSRPSVIESRKILQLFMPSYYPKQLKKDLNKKPILIIYTKQDHTHLEKELLKKSKKIFNNSKFELYSLPADSIFSANKNETADFTENKDTFIIDESSGYYLKSDFKIFHNSFDEIKSNKVYRGEGALSLKKTKFNFVYKSEPYQLDSGIVYNLSFWYYNNLYDQSFNSMWIEVKDSANQIIKSEYFDPVKSNIYDKNWAYNELNFKLNSNNDIVVLCSKGSEQFSDSIYIDELLIRPNNENIFKFITAKGSIRSLIIKNNETIYNK